MEFSFSFEFEAASAAVAAAAAASAAASAVPDCMMIKGHLLRTATAKEREGDHPSISLSPLPSPFLCTQPTTHS